MAEPLPRDPEGPASGDRTAERHRARRQALLGPQAAPWFLRAGLAFVFLYAALSSFLHPETFSAYFPAFLPASWATDLLPVFAVYEVLLAVALLTRRSTYAASLLAAMTLAGITASNPDAFEVLFRNVAIAGAALALAAQVRPERLRPELEAIEAAAEAGPPAPEAA